LGIDGYWHTPPTSSGEAGKAQISIHSVCQSHGETAEQVTDAGRQLLIPHRAWVYAILGHNGMEFAQDEPVAKKIDERIYFTHPSLL
jgi:hypothetical protein